RVEVFRRVFGEGLRNKNARIVYQHIDPAKSRYGSIHNRRCRAWMTDVSVNQGQICGCSERVYFSNLPRVCDYVVPSFQECFDESRSDPLRRTSNNCSFSCICHFISSFSVRFRSIAGTCRSPTRQSLSRTGMTATHLIPQPKS